MKNRAFRRGLFFVGVLSLSFFIFPKKIERFLLRRKIQAVSHLEIEGQGGFIDVENYLVYRHALKGAKRDKGIRNHLRLAEIKLLHPPLEEPFEDLVQNPPEWMVTDIAWQLRHFQKVGVGNIDEMIQKLSMEPHWKDKYLLARYKIRKGRVYVQDFSMKHNTLQYMNAALIRLAHSVSLPDVDFLISFHDSLDLFHLEVPLFVHCKRENNPFIIVSPDHEILMGYTTLDAKIDEAVVASPWREKQNVAFWRGSTTSGDFHLPNWRSFPRTKLVTLARENRAIDAKFSLYVQGAETNEKLLKETDLRGEFVFPEESLRYKYLIDIDGNASTYSRYYWILRSNSVPFKQMSTFRMWFYPALKPYIHFIPYKEDLTDLSEQVKWADENPRKAHKIAYQSREFILNELTQAHAFAYLYLLLQEYSKL